ncbi:MAG: glycoside hydrolase family 172 protein [Candidatus Merdivicinus sp.]|jgi:hypothetical protein
MEISILRDGRNGQWTSFCPQTGDKTVRIPPGETITLLDETGPGKITRIWFTFNGWFYEHWVTREQTIDSSILKLLILRIYWDGSEIPSVEVPVGDFFGIGHAEYRHFLSRYIGMSSGGFYCYFPMPFQSVRITLENRHDRINPHFFFNIDYTRLEQLPEGSGRFHCQFHTGLNPGADPTVILHTSGRGQYVGCTLSMQGKNPNYLSFLEAPEYFYIDGEEQASIIGTGLEDFFNGGWYFREGEFAGPLHGVPLKDPLRSMVSMYRFQEEDAVLFRNELRAEFRSPWRAEDLMPFWYSSAAYYYLDGIEKQREPFPDREALLGYYRCRDMDHQSIP